MQFKQPIKLFLLVNLGSPGKLSIRGIRSFLHNFLRDRRVVGLPSIIWYPILYGIILPFRPRKLLHKYKNIWMNETSPLYYYTRQQSENLKKANNSSDIIIRYAFSYSNPTILEVLHDIDLHYIVSTVAVIPLYPQYSSTTTASVFDTIAKYYHNKIYIPTLKFYNSFYNNQFYINAIVEKIKDSISKNGNGEKLIFSYHSLPQKLIDKGDTYYYECYQTTKLIVQKLGLSDLQYIIAFQSKFGLAKWLVPSTADTIKQLALNGIKNIDIVCPGFIFDCLETLEEICVFNKKIFLDNGGIKFNYIECLNNSALFTYFLTNLIKEL